MARNEAFGTFKNVQIGLSLVSGSPPTNTAKTRNTAQQSSSTLSTRNIGDRQLVTDPDGANASNGVPDFVNKTKGLVLATLASLFGPKKGTSQPVEHVVVAHSCNSCIKRTTLHTQLESKLGSKS